MGEEIPIADLRGMGTSYAAPLVSGFISLLLSNRPDLTPSDFIDKVSKYSRPVKKIDKCPECLPKGLVMSSSYLAN